MYTCLYNNNETFDRATGLDSEENIPFIHMAYMVIIWHWGIYCLI
jgi:hypothetical protein